VSLAISRGEKTIPVAYVDLSDEEENLVLASFDPISNAAATDSEKLNDLLQEITLDDGALDGLLSSLMDEGFKTTLMDVSVPDGERRERRLGEPAAQIKAVLYAEEVAVFEEALRSTGKMNRAHALIQICRFYLDQCQTSSKTAARFP
jgi:hypothetical protein